MTLNELRSQIDAINAQLITLLSERLSVALQIARIKKQERLPLVDSDREDFIQQRVLELARAHKLSAPIIGDIFQLLIDYTKVEMDREMQS